PVTEAVSLHDALPIYLEQGGNILIFPGPDGPVVGVNEFLREAGQVAIGDWMEEDMEALGLNFEDFVFSDVFEKQQSQLALPSVRDRKSTRLNSSHVKI